MYLQPLRKCPKNWEELPHVKCIYGINVRWWFFFFFFLFEYFCINVLVCSLLPHGWNGGVCLLQREPGPTGDWPWFMVTGWQLNFVSPFSLSPGLPLCWVVKLHEFVASRLHDLLMSNMSGHFRLRLLDFSLLMQWDIFFYLFQQIFRKKRLLL